MLTGLAIGLAGALGLTQFMAGLLYGVGSRDPSIFLGAAGLLAVVSLFACYVPAHRAAKVIRWSAEIRVAVASVASDQ